MMPIPWSLWLGGLGLLVAVWLAATWTALSDLSGGMIRKLEPKNRKLSERLEEYLGRRDDFRFLLRLLLTADVFLLLVCLISWDRHSLQISASEASRFTPIALGAIVFLLVAELLGRDLTNVTTGRFLTASIPVVRVLGLPFWPVAYLVGMWHRKTACWHERLAEDRERATAEDEIMSLVEQDEEGGDEENALEDDERRMIRGIFDLDETLVREIMTPRVDTHAVEDCVSIAELKARIVQSGHSRIPVYHENIDHMVGVVYAKDLLDDSKLVGSTSIQDLLHRPVFIPETKNIGDLLTEFQQNRNHFAVVIDEYGGTAGIVTFEDILEEIVGEIRDEYDADEPLPAKQQLPDGDFVVDARIPIDELNEMLDVNLPEDEDFDTLGGYISSEMGRIPRVGETIETEHLELEILSADPRRVLKAKIRGRSETEETS